jgi:hypothetical protein
MKFNPGDKVTVPNGAEGLVVGADPRSRENRIVVRSNKRDVPLWYRENKTPIYIATFKPDDLTPVLDPITLDEVVEEIASFTRACGDQAVGWSCKSNSCRECETAFASAYILAYGEQER